MTYFSLFPSILNSDGKLLTDITIRTKVKDSWLNNHRIYYSYDYQDHDRPEDIANKYYGDQGLGWLIIYTNSILDPEFDFPLSSYNFEIYLDNKYYSEGQGYINPQSGLPEPISGSQYALVTVDPIYGYQKQLTYEYVNNTFTQYFPIDETSYKELDVFKIEVKDPTSNELFTYSLSQRYPLVTIYDTEFEKNENKRTIKILKKEYVNQAKTELKNLLNQ